MAVYLVTWNLNNEKKNYNQARTDFINHLNSNYENTADSGLESVRFISTTQTADQVSTKLREKLDNNDKIIVTKLVTGNHQGWLNEAVWTWINKRI